MSARILVVEDESVVARDLQETLEELGYTVAAVASSGEEAIVKAEETKPDLVLMDIRLSGKLDGVDTATSLRQQMQLPVVYLTAYADDETVERAKATEPFGYLLKPFVDREVYSAVTIALERVRAERKLRQGKDWLAAVLQSMESGIIATDSDRMVLFMNPAAEALTGWKLGDAFGRNVKEVFSTAHPMTWSSARTPLHETLWEHAGSGFADATLRTASGGEVPIRFRLLPLHGEQGDPKGQILVFSAAPERRPREEAPRSDEAAEGSSVLDAGRPPAIMSYLSGIVQAVLVVALALLLLLPIVVGWIAVLGAVLALVLWLGLQALWNRLQGPSSAPGESDLYGAPADTDAGAIQMPQERPEEVFRSRALEQVQRAVWELDIWTGTIKWWDSLAPLTGVNPATLALRGSIHTLFQLVHDEDRAALKEALTDLERRTPDDPEFALEFRVSPPSVGIRWVLVQGRVLRDEYGGPSRVVGLALDITERKRAEDA